jgi:hypothetical protein
MMLLAQEAETPQIKFALLSAPVYNLDMRLSPQMERIYITASFTVERDSLNEADYYSFFLNKDANVESVKINDVLANMTLTSNLVPEHFNPVLPIPALLDSNSVVRCYSFKLADKFNPAGSASFSIKYWVPLPNFQDNPGGFKCSGYLSNQFWFPRNIEGPSRVNTKMVSSSSYKLELGPDCKFTDKDGIRTHQSSFQDSPDNTSTPFRIIKG